MTTAHDGQNAHDTQKNAHVAASELATAETPVEDQRDLIELLHSRGQRVTSQRLVILRELRRRGRHATAEEIHRAVHDELPGTATPTVYATLDLFVELGLPRRGGAGAAALDDARVDPP